MEPWTDSRSDWVGKRPAASAASDDRVKTDVMETSKRNGFGKISQDWMKSAECADDCDRSSALLTRQRRVTLEVSILLKRVPPMPGGLVSLMWPAGRSLHEATARPANWRGHTQTHVVSSSLRPVEAASSRTGRRPPAAGRRKIVTKNESSPSRKAGTMRRLAISSAQPGIKAVFDQIHGPKRRPETMQLALLRSA